MAFQIGEILLDKYRIEARLGGGAFGDVYRVRHLALQVPRALKVLRQDAPGVGKSDYKSVAERFHLEAQIGARLNNPGPNPRLLQVHDLIERDGLLALDMEYAPGGSLDARIKKELEGGQAFSVEQVLQIGLDVAEGLTALHDIDVVHRDLKPGNILLDEKQRAKLGDLGLAQFPGGHSGRSLLSEPARQVGTPEYMSPEQASSGSLLTSASDIFSLGCTLFEALTGRLYNGLRPGTRARSLRADIPVELDDLLARMLADNPRERPWDGKECFSTLRNVSQRLALGHIAQTGAPSLAGVQSPGEGFAGAVRSAPRPSAGSLQSSASTPVPGGPVNRSGASPISWASIKDMMDEKPVTGQADGLVTKLAGDVELEFVRIPAGKFSMGRDPKKDKAAKPDESPAHQVSLGEYLIGKFPVTNLQYQAFVRASGHTPPMHWAGGRIPAGKEKHPVVCVSWFDAEQFCQWASQTARQEIRLPSEAEWEMAARGPQGKPYPWGSPSPSRFLCNYNKIFQGTTPVGQFGANSRSHFGCLDMAGNVAEWVADWYAQDYYRSSPSVNPRGPATGQERVLRGGSWLSEDVRAADRYRFAPQSNNYTIGFRCARSGS